MARRMLAGAAAVVAVAVLWVWARESPSPMPPRSAATNNAPASRAATIEDGRRAALADVLRRAAQAEPLVWAPPASLRDTDIDGALVVDADGHLVVAPALRRFFEYFFVASGEESSERIRARIEAQIRVRLNGDAQRAALELFDRYLAYREAGRSLATATAGDGDLGARFDALRRLRRDSFGETDAAALFADEDAAYAVALAQRRIAADPTLTDDERAAQLEALDAQLPAPLRETRTAVTAPLRLAREEAALRAAGGSAEEIQTLREQAVGPAAAARLADLDQRRAAWQQRVDTYRQERTAIDLDPSLDATQRAAALQALRERHFSGPELVRIQALDGMQ